MHSAPAHTRVLLPPRPWLPAVALGAGLGLAYANTFSVPFVFDDVAAISQNPGLVSLGSALSPPAGLSTAVRQRPDNSSLRYQLAGALLSSGRIAEAIPHLAEVVRRQPTAAAHYNYGRALTDVGRYPEALVQFETAAHLDPLDASAPANAARLREFLAK